MLALAGVLALMWTGVFVWGRRNTRGASEGGPSREVAHAGVPGTAVRARDTVIDMRETPAVYTVPLGSCVQMKGPWEPLHSSADLPCPVPAATSAAASAAGSAAGAGGVATTSFSAVSAAPASAAAAVPSDMPASIALYPSDSDTRRAERLD